jgi:hypothetical protein
VPDSGSRTSSSVRTLALTPAWAPGHAEPHARQVVAPPVGQGDDAGAQVPRHLDGASIAPVRDETRAASPSVRPRRAASSGWTCRRAAGGPRHEARQVVHPRVVGPQVPPADQDERGHRGVERGMQALDVGRERRRRELDPARTRCAGGRAGGGRSGPRSMPCGAASSAASDSVPGPGAPSAGKPLAVRPGAQEQVDHPRGPHPRRELGEHGVRVESRRLALAQPARDERVERRPRPRPAPGRSPRPSAAAGPPTRPGPPRAAAARVPTSSPRRGRRRCTAPGRSARARAATGPAGRRRRGASSR